MEPPGWPNCFVSWLAGWKATGCLAPRSNWRASTKLGINRAGFPVGKISDIGYFFSVGWEIEFSSFFPTGGSGA